jgi:hypothetical protein
MGHSIKINNNNNTSQAKAKQRNTTTTTTSVKSKKKSCNNRRKMWFVYICDEEEKELGRQKASGCCPYCGGKVEAIWMLRCNGNFVFCLCVLRLKENIFVLCVLDV